MLRLRVYRTTSRPSCRVAASTGQPGRRRHLATRGAGERGCTSTRKPCYPVARQREQPGRTATAWPQVAGGVVGERGDGEIVLPGSSVALLPGYCQAPLPRADVYVSVGSNTAGGVVVRWTTGQTVLPGCRVERSHCYPGIWSRRPRRWGRGGRHSLPLHLPLTCSRMTSHLMVDRVSTVDRPSPPV